MKNLFQNSLKGLTVALIALSVACGGVELKPGSLRDPSELPRANDFEWIRYSNGKCWREETKDPNFFRRLFGASPDVLRTQVLCRENDVMRSPKEMSSAL